MSSAERLPDMPLSLLNLGVYLASEWRPAGLACFLCLLASRSLYVVSVISEPAKASNIKSWLSTSVGSEQCMVGKVGQLKPVHSFPSLTICRHAEH